MVELSTCCFNMNSVLQEMILTLLEIKHLAEEWHMSVKVLAIETGGAIHSSGAIITFFSGNNTLVQNQAHNGGALYATRSRVEVHNASLLMANNTALDTGGAIHLNEGQLVFSCGKNT